MELKVPLLYGHYYHIYHRGNNGINVFLDSDNYYYFLRLYAKYIEPVADTFAYCLLQNHFHLLIRIKQIDEIRIENFSYTTTCKPKLIAPYLQFSHFFNAYTQGMNKRYHRTGSLFETRYERKLVESKNQLKLLIIYLHHNAVLHNIASDVELYPWSSYSSLLSSRSTLLKREMVFELFGGRENFLQFHQGSPDTAEISDLIIEY